MSTKQLALTLFFAGFLGISSEREHKVHNIVLYPEKHSWCQITPIQQIIASPGYESVTIDNNVCVGACYSYSIPKTQPAEPGELIGPYCDSCQPSEIKCYHVNLRQMDKNVETPILQKRVQIITNCSCQSCDKVRTEDCEITDENTLELPQNLFTIDKNSNKSYSEEVPDILETNNTQHIQLNTDNDVKKQKYRKWFESHQNEIERDYSSDLYRLFLKQNRDNNMKIEEDLSRPDIPINFGLEGAHSGLKGSHIAMGISPKTIDNSPEEDDDDEEDETDGTNSKLTQMHPNDVVVLETKHHDVKSGESGGLKPIHHQRHHHVGEEDLVGMNVVQMIKGPHGSLVAAPVEAKLQIDSDALKPNSEGVVIDYGTVERKTQNKVAELFDN